MRRRASRAQLIRASLPALAAPAPAAASGPLSGRFCAVTGVGRGVGKGVALGLGEAGATVFVTGRSRRGAGVGYVWKAVARLEAVDPLNV